MTDRVAATYQASGESKAVRLSTAPRDAAAAAHTDKVGEALARPSTSGADMEAGWLQGVWGMRRCAGCRSCSLPRR